MKILILNWRDPKSPLEGGAERFTQKYAEFWAKNGHEVYWLTNSFPNCLPKEKRRGVTYHRVGPQMDGSFLRYLVCFPLYLITAVRFAITLIQQEDIDIVIDEIHGLPHFAPLFSRKRNILLTCEVAGVIWDKTFPFPISTIGKWVERQIYKLYRNCDIWAISKNTKRNISQLLPRKKVGILELGVEKNSALLHQIRKVHKNNYPSAIFLARLVKMKGVESALRATAQIAHRYPKFKLTIVGKGSQMYEQELRELVTSLQITKNVEFIGFKDGIAKYRELKKAHVLLHPSYKEGFGLTVLEAGLVGTPAIVRSGSSLDDLVENDVNGFVFSKASQIAHCFTKLYSGKSYRTLERGAVKKASYYLWPDVLQRSSKMTTIC